MKRICIYLFILLLVNTFVCYSIFGQNKLFKNPKYEYSTYIDSSGVSYVDTVYFYFQYEKKHIKEKDRVSGVVFVFGLINDTIYCTITSQLGCLPFTKNITFEPHRNNGVIVYKSKYDFLYKVNIAKLKLQDINFSFLSVHFRYFEGANYCRHEYFNISKISLNQFKEYKSKNHKVRWDKYW